MIKRVDVQLCGPFGPTFEVVGEWIPYIPATELQPEEGGFFDDPAIKYNQHDVTNWLGPRRLMRPYLKAGLSGSATRLRLHGLG